MPISSLVTNFAILAALGIGYVLVLAAVLTGARWAGRGGRWTGSEVALSAAIGVAIVIAVTVVVDAIGAALRLDLVIGSLPPDQAELLQLALRIALVMLYVLAVVAGTLASRPVAMRLGRGTSLSLVVPLAIVLFIVLSLPVTDLLHACYLQTTVALPSRC